MLNTVHLKAANDNYRRFKHAPDADTLLHGTDGAFWEWSAALAALYLQASEAVNDQRS